MQIALLLFDGLTAPASLTLSRKRAWTVVVAFAATLAFGLVLLGAFEPDVQTIDAEELVNRSDDARAFLVADYVLIVLYAVLGPVAQRRSGARSATRASAAGSSGLRSCSWRQASVDATENTLLLWATDSPSGGAVDAAHALSIPKFAFAVAGLCCPSACSCALSER